MGFLQSSEQNEDASCHSEKPAPTQQDEPLQLETNTKTTPVFSGVRTSKFRHLHGVPMHKSNNIENVRNLSMSTFGDCDGLQVNRKFVVYPLAGPGGQLAALQVGKPKFFQGVRMVRLLVLRRFTTAS